MIQEANLSWRYTDTESNLIMPWYTKPALEWLKKQDVKGWQVFEFGAGYSSVWWRANCAELTSVDTIQSWAVAMGAVWLTDKKDYIEFVSMVSDGDLFDCIIVDGEWREECVEFSLDYLKSGGFMIIDNWGQDDFPQSSCDKADELLAGWKKTLYKQPNHSMWTTAVFVKP